MNVDVHSHIVDRQYLDNLVSTLALATESTNDGKRLFRKDGSTVAWSRDDMFDIDRRLDDMDKKDIAVRILSLSAPLARTPFAYLAFSSRRHRRNSNRNHWGPGSRKPLGIAAGSEPEIFRVGLGAIRTRARSAAPFFGFFKDFRTLAKPRDETVRS
jgi:hypothetical protein